MLFVTSLVVAVMPGIWRWWWSRRFLAAPDEPLQAERWLAYRTRSTYISTAAAVVCGLIQPSKLYVWLPLLWLASAIGGFHARRAVFGERWSLASYLAWTLRLVVAVWGFWLLLAAVPWLVSRTASWGWAIAATAILLAWQHWYATVLVRVLSARPFVPDEENPALADGFRRVIERAALPSPPAIWRAGPAESVLANAVAIPSVSRPAILFSNALVAALSPDETTAILGHEVAHLEEFSTRRLAMIVTTPALVLFAVFLVPRLPYASSDLIEAGWPLMLLVVLSMRVRYRQQHETASDRRAVELCGNWQAVASALTKLYALGRIPRRWSIALEERSSHPSLARRLAALRTLDGAPSALVSPVIIEGADHTTWVTLEADRMRHLTGVPPGVAQDPASLAAAASRAKSLPYATLRELRVVGSSSRAAVLRVRDLEGRISTCPLESADVPRVQAALDAVDHLIAHASPPGGRAPLLALAIALAIALIGMTSGSTALAVLGVLTAASLSPASIMAAGVGVATLVAGAVGGLPWAPHGGALTIALLGVVAALAMLCAGRWTPPPTRRQWLAPAILATATLVVWIGSALFYPDLLALHRLAYLHPTAAVLPAALAGALWQLPGQRAWSAAAAALALIAAAVGTPWFESNIVRDALMASGPIFRAHPLSLSRLVSGEAPAGAIDLRVSPDGRRFIVAIADDEDEPSGTFVVGTIGGSSQAVAAEDVEFVDSNNFLVLRHEPSGGLLALRDFSDPGADRWQHVEPIPEHADLTVDAATGRWRLTGQSRTELVRIVGTVGSEESRATLWPLPATGPYSWVIGDEGPLGVERERVRGFFGSLSLAYAFRLGVPWYGGALCTLGTDGHVQRLAKSSQVLECLETVPAQPAYCLASDRAETSVWAFQQGVLQPKGRLGVELAGARATPDGLLAGWAGHRVVFVDPQHAEWLEPAADAARLKYGEWTSARPAVGVLLQKERRNEIVTFLRR